MTSANCLSPPSEGNQEQVTRQDTSSGKSTCSKTKVSSEKVVIVTNPTPMISTPKEKYKPLTFVHSCPIPIVRRAKSNPELPTEPSASYEIPKTVSLLMTSSPKAEWRDSLEFKPEPGEGVYNAGDDIEWLESVFSVSFEEESLSFTNVTTLSKLQGELNCTAGGGDEQDAVEGAKASRGEQMRRTLSTKLTADDSDTSEFTTSTLALPVRNNPEPCDKQSKLPNSTNTPTCKPRHTFKAPRVPPGSTTRGDESAVRTIHGAMSVDRPPGGNKAKSKSRHLTVGRDPLREPTRHISTNRKREDWTIDVRKPNVFLGDSNLSRISAFSSSNIQIDSYPGMFMDHLTDLLKKTPPHNSVAKVIISVGILNCVNVNLEPTLKSCVNRLKRAAMIVFPNASIYWALLNRHELLASPQQHAIMQFNDIIISKCNFLSEINSQFFNTTDDGIHWTGKTANNIFLNWLDQLNL